MALRGTTPVKTSAAHMYKIVHRARVPIIATGKSLWGFFVSSAAVEIASNPIYAKKITNAPVKIPSKPLGAKGVQFSGFT